MKVDALAGGLATEIDRRIDVTRRSPTLDLVIPVFNEVRNLAPSIRLLGEHLSQLPISWRLTIADNASTDGTWEVAAMLAESVPGVRAVHLPLKGRGRALRAAWSESDATVVAYADVDLSTDLCALYPLVASILSDHSDITIGSRLAPGARVIRGPKRELISRVYNTVLHVVAQAGFSDAQCGFKALRADVARELLPVIENQNWFFDTELLLAAERRGLRIREVPVDWVDDPDSRVHVAATALEDLRGLARLTRSMLAGRAPVPREGGMHLNRQILSFTTVGATTAIMHVALFAAFSSGMAALVANGLALCLAAAANMALNRLLTFGKPSTHRLARDRAEAGAAFLAGLALSSAALGALGLLWPAAPHRAAAAVILLSSAVVLGVRVVLLMAWGFDPVRRSRA